MDRQTIKNIETILDYVERWNKKDEDKEVAIAAAELEEWLKQYTVVSIPL